MAYRLYLPQDWAQDEARRAKAGVPRNVVFKTKPEIALDQIRAACAAGLRRGVVLMDAGYGPHSQLRRAVTNLELTYVAGILSLTTVWPPGTGPLPPRVWTPGRGRPTKRLRRDAEHQPRKIKELAFSLPARGLADHRLAERYDGALTSRFARLRVRIARRDFDRSAPWPEEWLLIEWPEGKAEPTKYWLSTLLEDIGLARLVDVAKLRWRIERDYHDLKQEVGLGHFEGRGFHHHATLCIAAYGLLICERQAFPPSGARRAGLIQAASIPPDHRPRGTPAENRASRPDLDRDHAPETGRSHRPKLVSLSVLCTNAHTNAKITNYVTSKLG